ncbi:MAG TPA: SPOR domain-containing protein [Gemmatimonadaceae bacterium]|nr:SPOR domain-containing protein [Gemmatimonadaceae bacterium]
MRRLLLLALLCLACKGEQAAPDRTATSEEPRGADPLLLRVPRVGGTGRIYVYPRLDSTVWTVDEAPAIKEVLGFDGNEGLISYVDSKGQPGRLDLRETDVRRVTKTKLTSLATSNGSDIFGIDAKGIVVRLSPSGTDWKFQPPLPARTVFAQPNGDLIIAANKGAQTLVWKVRPPDSVVQDSAVLPLSGRGVRTQVGDRVYFTVDSGLVGIRVKDFSPVGAIQLESRVRAVAPTPSGDRLYVATLNDTSISVVDRYTERVQSQIGLPQSPLDFRMDPLGRYLLVRFPKSDSAWVIAIGTNRVVGAVGTRWEDDLPTVTPDGSLALLGSKDVTFVEPEKLTQKRAVANGAKDFWYFFAWDGFRPRARGLDQPVTFPSDSFPTESIAASSSPSGPQPATPQTPADSVRAVVPGTSQPVRPVSAGFTVSFAALLSEEKARDLASAIMVNGTPAHVVASSTAGSSIFRVVMGPYPTRDEADKIGKASRREYWIYEGSP